MIERSLAMQLAQRAVDDDLAAVAPRAGTEIDDVLGAANRLLVVLDDDDRVALRHELLDRVEQQRVVARVQADRRLVEDVADAAQIRAELRGEPDALRFAARQRRRRAIERQITQADEIEKTEPADELRHDVARDLAFARPSFSFLNETSESATERAVTSAIVSPWKRTASASGFSRRPAHACRSPRRASASVQLASSPLCSASNPASSTPVPKHAGHQP